MILDLSQNILIPLLFTTGLIAGTVDAIAGGGGLISLPVLLGLGVPPSIALGTNKLQSSIGTLASTWSYYKKGWISLHVVALGLAFGILGSAVGATISQIISGHILAEIIPILLLIILTYTLFVPKKWSEEQTPKMKAWIFYIVFGFLLGFYDGFFGPGAGAFCVFALTYFLGYNLTKATAYTKILNLSTNIAALLCFAIGHNIDYRIGLCMAAGQIIGGRLGAHLAIKKGAAFIRPIFIVMVCATLITLAYRNFIDAEDGLLKIILMIGAITGLLTIYFWNNYRKKLKLN